MRLIALALVLALPVRAPAQDKPPTIDQLIERIVELRKQKAELEKQEAAAAAELKARLKELQDKLDKLGIDTPPAPTPKPADPLKKKLAAALEADKAPKADVMQLAAIYREAAKVCADPEVPTSRELLTRVRKVAEALIGAEALPTVRGTAAEELLAVLGMTSDEPLTDSQRKRTAELFVRLAAILEDLVK